MRKALGCAVALAAFGLLSGAGANLASVAGDWDVTYSNSEGSHTAFMRLGQNGETVKGTVRGEGLSDGVIDGRVEDTKLGFAVRFYDSRRRLGSPTGCSATLEAGSLKGSCREHAQNWVARRRS
jgi:hypothetical protein